MLPCRLSPNNSRAKQKETAKSNESSSGMERSTDVAVVDIHEEEENREGFSQTKQRGFKKKNRVAKSQEEDEPADQAIVGKQSAENYQQGRAQKRF